MSLSLKDRLIFFMLIYTESFKFSRYRGLKQKAIYKPIKTLKTSKMEKYGYFCLHFLEVCNIIELVRQGQRLAIVSVPNY